MKDETKNKIKNGVKYTAISVGVILLFLLGMGIGSCSEKAQSRKAVEASAVDDSLNLLDYGTRYDGRLIYTLNENEFAIVSQNWAYSYTIPRQYLTGNSYVLTFDASDGYDYSNSYIAGVSNMVNNALATDLEYYEQRSGNLKALSSPYFGQTSPYFFSLPAGFLEGNYTYLYLRCPAPLSGLFLSSEEDYLRYLAPSIANLALPLDFNPIWLFGDAYQNAVYGMLSNNSAGYSYSALLDVTFRCNGVLYSGVGFTFEPLADTWYQEPATGEIKQADHNANNYHYPLGLYYKRYGTGSGFPDQHPDYYDCVWTPVWGLSNDSQGNSVRYLTPTGAFASQAFRSLEVLAYSSSVPVSGRWPNLNALELLSLKASGYLITGEKTIYDVFDMFSGAFNSFTSVMNIQILPFMTIGMLMFIPLIVIVILAVVRLLNK